jgi:hypothetical protein
VAKPRPSPEDARIRHTFTLARKLSDGVALYRARHPEKPFADFSAFMNEVTAEYLERHHPGLIKEVVDEIRMNSIQKAAEPKAKPPDKQSPSAGAGPLNRVPMSAGTHKRAG